MPAGAEPQLTGSSAAGGRRQCALLEEFGVEQLLHPLRYDRAAETGPSGPTRPGARRTGAHEVQHVKLVVGASSATGYAKWLCQAEGWRMGGNSQERGQPVKARLLRVLEQPK